MLTQTIAMRRLEAAAIFCACLLFYNWRGAGWTLLLLLFFLPDAAAIFYMVNKKWGGAAYNLTHFFLWPILLIALALLYHQKTLLPFGLIWAAHISFDRMLGWGLKTEAGFYNTDMGDKKPLKLAGLFR